MKRWLSIFALFACLFVSFAHAEPVFSSQTLYQELHPFFPRAQIRFFDKAYESLSSKVFLGEFLPEYAKYLQEKGMKGIDAGFSEKHYAQLCKSQLQIWLVQREHRSIETETAVLVTDPQAKASRPNLPTGWMLLRMDGRWAVFDAARFVVIPLEQFEEKNSILAVQF